MDGDVLGIRSKKLHPFFAGPPRPAPPDDRASTSATSSDSGNLSALSFDGATDSEGDTDDETDAIANSRRKRLKVERDASQVDEEGSRPRRPKKKMKASGGSIADHFIRLDRNVNPPASIPHCGKRDNSEGVARLDDLQNNVHIKSLTTIHDPQQSSTAEPLLQIPQTLSVKVSSPMQDDPAERRAEQRPSTPKPSKILRFDHKTYTTGFPPAPTLGRGDSNDRGQVLPREKIAPSRVIKIHYAKDEDSRARIGKRIDDALRAASSRKRSGTLQPGASVDQAKSKEVHPFFRSKVGKKHAVADGDVAKSRTPCPHGSAKQFTSTPYSPTKPRGPVPSVKLPQFGVRSGGLRIPGAMLPAWPCKDMVHTRGCEPPPHVGNMTLPARKCKGNSTSVSPEESVIRLLTGRLDLSRARDVVKRIDTENFTPPPPELRLPVKHFESGLKLGRRILPELRSVLPEAAERKMLKQGNQQHSDPGLDLHVANSNALHPSLTHIYGSIRGSLSAFDESQCESLCWAHKYSPAAAIEVLQAGREPFLLRDWLQTLKVQSVDTGAPDADAPKSSSLRRRAAGKATAPAKKKRKKNELAGFIVDSDEEANEMDEISEAEDECLASGGHGVSKKTVIRAGDTAARDSKNASRLTNTVLISGPHGCGKTAAVYAIAKELDFEVFEINPSSRRSGKDVLEKIGDMTRNHLVQRHQSNPTASENIEEEIVPDIKSGKQATMNSFFKPRSDSTGLKSTQDGTERVLKPKVEVNKALSKGQKQSLILLEEADIIYEEDKQFWTVVIGLIAQSKRPFIITCNDENLIPLQSLSLHGIFRFSSPPVEIAVDRLLMIAACEGHALRRDAVEALYQTRKHDIRACLMDLNYWCQIGVGDRKGGFDWFFPRWPKGIDLDEDSNVVRVVSEGTYLTGMGWLDRDSIPSDGDELWTEEELLQQAWDFWRVDLGDWQDSLDMESWVEHLNVSLISTTRANVLEVYDEFADDMSAADLYGHMGFSTSFAEQIDPTLPEISHKARDDYTVGQQLLEAPIRYDHDTLRTALPSTLRCLTLQHLCSAHERIASGTETPQLERLNEGKVISNIRRKFTETSPSTPAITRHDYSLAFDAIAASDNPTTVLQGSSSGYLDASVFDRTMTMITVDVAPYVRGIVAYDNRLQQQRLKLSNLVSQGGKKNGAKRMRTTRAAYSALEGGSRSTTRPERWFKAELNNHLVMRTGGADWQKAVDETAKECEGVRSSKDTDRESEDELGSN